jgi:hypothetical protein
MDISLKHKIAEKIIESENDALLNEIKSLIGLYDEDFWDHLPKEVQNEINYSKNEHDNSEGIPHLEVMQEVKNRFLK